jgi:tetratricopeptide (TPR) repeat protein
VKKQQAYIAIGGVILLFILVAFGTTVAKKVPTPVATDQHNHKEAFNIDNYIVTMKKKLSTQQLNYITSIENSVKRGDVKQQQEQSYTQLANFWRDSLDNHEVYVFYISKAALLVNSEKSLSFAAQLILREAKIDQEIPVKEWKADRAIELFEKAIALNPSNDSLQVSLASCYVFGKSQHTDQLMSNGIQKLLAIVKKDSANMQAQLVLGIGAVISTQYPKAIQRLETVVKAQPTNMEAITWLAEAFEASGDKANAIKWFEYSKKVANNALYNKEIDAHIKQLQ